MHPPPPILCWHQIGGQLNTKMVQLLLNMVHKVFTLLWAKHNPHSSIHPHPTPKHVKPHKFGQGLSKVRGKWKINSNGKGLHSYLPWPHHLPHLPPFVLLKVYFLCMWPQQCKQWCKGDMKHPPFSYLPIHKEEGNERVQFSP